MNEWQLLVVVTRFQLKEINDTQRMVSIIHWNGVVSHTPVFTTVNRIQHGMGGGREKEG